MLFLTACAEQAADEGTATAGNSPAGTSEGLDGVTVDGAAGEAPTVQVDDGFSVEETTAEVLQPGDGEAVQADDTVTVHYVGVNASSGKAFDSSWDRGQPVDFPLGQSMLPGFNKALVGQEVGSRVVAAIPPGDGFGAAGNPQAKVGPDDILVFVFDIQGIVPTMAQGEAVEPPVGVPDLKVNAQGQPTGFSATEQTARAPEQLQVHTVIRGEGPKVEAGQTLTVHYLGQIYPDGKIFDQSWSRGAPATFPVGAGQLIPGWDKGLVGVPVGSRVILVVPPAEGYGEAGNPQIGVTGTDTLIFAVDILKASGPQGS